MFMKKIYRFILSLLVIYSFFIQFVVFTADEQTVNISITCEKVAPSIKKADCSTAVGDPMWTIGSGTPASEGSVSVMGDSDGLCIDNTPSNVAIDISLKATTSNWTLSTTPSTDTISVRARFESTNTPALTSADFDATNDSLSTTYVQATTSSGNGKFEGSASGYNVADNATVYLYFAVWLPTSNTQSDPQTVTIYIKSEAHA